MERKVLSAEQTAILNRPLPEEAVKPHPTKKFLSSINSIYVTERLNECFGVGAWEMRTEWITTEKKEQTKQTPQAQSQTQQTTVSTMVVVKVSFDVPEYGIHYESFGGNNNADLGDAYKGATTDALTKIGSWLGIGAHVWKNQPNAGAQPAQAQQPKPQQKKRLSDATIDNRELCDRFCEWLYAQYKAKPAGFDAVKVCEQYYDVDELVKPRIMSIFVNYVAEKKEIVKQPYQ